MDLCPLLRLAIGLEQLAIPSASASADNAAMDAYEISRDQSLSIQPVRKLRGSRSNRSRAFSVSAQAYTNTHVSDRRETADGVSESTDSSDNTISARMG